MDNDRHDEAFARELAGLILKDYVRVSGPIDSPISHEHSAFCGELRVELTPRGREQTSAKSPVEQL